MTIDIRATCTCSLGTLISASVSDDYIQGSGLIKVRGNCVIDGIITPDVGTIVTFAYTKSGVTTTLPRKLRVLSSFADPFRRTTTVELGCKLTYLQDLKEPVKWNGLNDPFNTDLNEADAEIITIPIYASSVAAECAAKLNIAAAVPLANSFSIPEFDFSAGYVNVLSDLLVSECFCGYLDANEVLQVFSLDQIGGTGPVLDRTKIIDIGPIGVGQLPAEAVFVTYSTLKLKNAEEEDALKNPAPLVMRVQAQDPSSELPSIYVKEGDQMRFDITLSAETTEEVTYDFILTGTATVDDDYDPSITWSDGVSETESGKIAVPAGVRSFSATVSINADEVTDDRESLSLTVDGVTGFGFILDVEEEKPEEEEEEKVLGGWEKSSSSVKYDLPISYTLNGESAIKSYPVLESSETVTTYVPLKLADGETIRVVSKRITTEKSCSAAIAGAMVTEYLSNGISFNNETVTKVTTETFVYDDAGNEKEYERLVDGSLGYIAGAAGVPFVFNQNDYVSLDFKRTVWLEKERRETLTSGTLQRVAAYFYGPWARTMAGQQSIAASRDSLTTSNEVEAYLEHLFVNKGLSLLNVSVSIQESGGPQRAPSREDLINAENVEDLNNATEQDSGAIAETEKEKKEVPNPANNWRIESTSESEFAMGSPAAQRRIEFSMPYAPDDRFYKFGIEPNVSYSSVKSMAAVRAQQFGRVQNRLLLGNRCGMNVQVAPESLPSAPFSPVFVSADGYVALYRTNGTSYTMDANGIVASSDLLFMGGVGTV